MGTGKTTVGRELARLMGMKFLELDRMIEKEVGLSIKEIFSRYGEEYFRDRESDMVRKVSDKEGLVISTGGGVVLRKENMDALRKKGIIVWLKAKPETILERTLGSDERPLLNVEDPEERIRKLLQERKPYYEEADLSVDTDGLSPLQVAERIKSLLRQYTH
jgi:shikimate kinase